ncbi:MAG TPA: hypothetical protein VLJ17_14745 [Xanthobacteraceae bacterium]|nr:hypothetical protein [Xanthobacteraceae bacterium]
MSSDECNMTISGGLVAATARHCRRHVGGVLCGFLLCCVATKPRAVHIFGAMERAKENDQDLKQALGRVRARLCAS